MQRLRHSLEGRAASSGHASNQPCRRCTTAAFRKCGSMRAQLRSNKERCPKWSTMCRSAKISVSPRAAATEAVMDTPSTTTSGAEPEASTRSRAYEDTAIIVKDRPATKSILNRLREVSTGILS